MHAPSTVRAYRADWADFVAWAGADATPPVAPATVAAYVADLGRTRRPATVHRRLAAIADAHRRAGHPSPTNAVEVRVAAARIDRDQRDRVRPTEPLTVPDLRRILRALPPTRAGGRDRALLLVGLGAALRPSELVGLDVADVTSTRNGLRIATDRRVVTIPPGSAPDLCAVRAWRAWRPLNPGPAFRAVSASDRVLHRRLDPKSVTFVVKRAAAAAGLDSDRVAARSLRRGMVAAAAARGVGEDGVMHQTGHRSRRLVRSYLRGEP